MSRDDEIDELRDEIDELKNLIKNLSKSQTEAYKDLDDSENEHVKERLERDVERLEREKLHREAIHRNGRRKPEPPEPPIPPVQPMPPMPPIGLEDFHFEFDADEFKEKLKDLKKKVEKATREGMKTAEKISEKMQKEFHKFLEVETDKITKTSGLSDEEFKDMKADINLTRKDIDLAQQDVEEERRKVEAVRRTSLGIRRRLERAYRENDLKKQVEIERELKKNETELREAMEGLSRTRTALAQTKREFARLQRRATKIHSAQKGKGVRVVAPSDFDVDGTISEYVTKVVDSVGKNLESSLRTVWGEGKKGMKRIISINGVDDTDELGSTSLSNGRVTSKSLEQFYEEASNLLSALGDDKRLMILKILENSPQYQKELAEDTELRGGQFGHHTKVLSDEGYITREAVRGRYLITQLGLEALKLAEMIYLRRKQLEELDEEIGIDIDIE